MKIFLVVIILSVIISPSLAQTLEAHYLVSKEIFMDIERTPTKIADVQSTAFLYRKDNRYIYFEKPNYLQKYPNGLITTKTSTSEYVYELSADTLQRLNFHDLDSLIRISRMTRSGNGKVDYNIKDKVGRIKFNIEYLVDNKKINGLYCQKANLSISGILQWVVWFAPSIPTEVNIVNIINLPGLIVEAEMVPLKTKYILQNYELGKQIDEKIFHPLEFNQRYQNPAGVPLDKQTEKVNKQLELKNGN